MVVWVFAGGGESEIRGLIPFLEKHFTCTFERKTPVRMKPGPKPNIKGYGYTGKSLVQQIERKLADALQYSTDCDLILIIDDLDCRDEVMQRQMFLTAVDKIPGTQNINCFVAFAAPELEAWLIADWDNTIARHIDFRAEAQAMRHWLSQKHQIPFNQPETFGHYNSERDTCEEKLSDLLIEASMGRAKRFFSKGFHTPLLLQQNVRPKIVSQKCPLFRQMYKYLTDFCNNS